MTKAFLKSKPFLVAVVLLTALGAKLGAQVALTNDSALPFDSASDQLLTPSPPGTNSPLRADSNNAVPPEIDSTLAQSRDVVTSTNLLPPAAARSGRALLEVFEQKLDHARRQRRVGDFEQAEKNLTAVLMAKAPREICRSTLLELALLAQEQKQLARAQQVYAQYLKDFHDDASVPEVLLRQGLIYREMGAPVLALSKFYAVMSSALTLKYEQLAYYQRLVLQAQTEIAETYYLDGKFEDAAGYFARLLKLDHAELNREMILFKFVRSWWSAERYTETVAQAELFVARHPQSEQSAEVRFMLADSLKRLGRKQDALRQVVALMEDRRAVADLNRENWQYWQQKTGNELANYLYNEGDHVNALDIYLRLANLNTSPAWRLPALYQAGLICERLKQPQRAADLYSRIIGQAKESLGAEPPASLKLVLEMALWRKDHLDWQTRADLANREVTRALAPAGVSSQ